MIKYILLLIIILLIILQITLGLTNYNSRKIEEHAKENFSFLNQFPYEMQNDPSMKYNFPFSLVSALLGVSYSCYGIYVFLLDKAYLTKSLHEYVLASLFIIMGILIFLLFVVNLKFYKVKLIISSLLFTLTVVNPTYLGFYILIDNRNTYNTFLAYILFFIASVCLISLIVTPLKRWMYLEKEEKDGTVRYYRKRISVLPFMEWIFILINFVVILLLTIF